MFLLVVLFRFVCKIFSIDFHQPFQFDRRYSLLMKPLMMLILIDFIDWKLFLVKLTYSNMKTCNAVCWFVIFTVNQCQRNFDTIQSIMNIKHLYFVNLCKTS